MKQGCFQPTLGVALYARTASTQPEDQGQSAAQVAALWQRIREDGLRIAPELCFVDEGCSGATLERPALQRLRERAAAGEVQRLYIQSADRLTRRHSHYLKLVEELRQSGVTLLTLPDSLGALDEPQALSRPQVVIAPQPEGGKP